MSDELKARIGRLEQEIVDLRSQSDSLGRMLEKSNNQAHTFYNISKVIAATNDLQVMIPDIIGFIRKSISFDRVTFFLTDARREKLVLRYADGIPLPSPVSFSIGEGLPGRIAEIGEHSHVHNLSLFYETFNDFIHVPGEEKHDGAYIGIALKSQYETIGVIGIDCPVKYGLSVEDMDFLALTSHQISAGIEKSNLFTKTEELAQLDGLTGLYNHRVFKERLVQEVNRRNRSGKPLSLIMLDIDHFKRFNDSYGHQAGDAILKELAAVIKGQCRYTTMDMCFRYGGEEFAVLLSELELNIALKVAERIRRVVEKHPFGIKSRHPETTLTVSLGVAGMSGSDDLHPEELLKQADDALYRSKKAGRNLVMPAPPAET
ncbi:MAG: sensor domain-containing diguanylate cyclase [Nitrospirota bacterium]